MIFDALGDIYHDLDKKDKAYHYYREAKKHEPTNPLYAFHLGILLLENDMENEEGHTLLRESKYLMKDEKNCSKLSPELKEQIFQSYKKYLKATG